MALARGGHALYYAAMDPTEADPEQLRAILYEGYDLQVVLTGSLESLFELGDFAGRIEGQIDDARALLDGQSPGNWTTT